MDKVIKNQRMAKRNGGKLSLPLSNIFALGVMPPPVYPLMYSIDQYADTAHYREIFGTLDVDKKHLHPELRKELFD